jgi:putative phage-type endonuclease
MTFELDAEINDSKSREQYSGCSKDRDRDRGQNGDGYTAVETETEPACIPSAPYSILPSDEDRETIINDALDELAEIARENILEFKREDFDDEAVIGAWIDSYLCQYFSEMTPHRSNYSTTTTTEANALNDVLDAYICELYDELFERFYEEIAPFRASVASVSSASSVVSVTTDVMTQKIQTLREKPQPDQRTPEWYARRNNLITASAASKAFGSQASVNQLVYEKCKNYSAAAAAAASTGTGTEHASSPQGPLQGSVNSPLHWGHRYEPVTVMVYEYRNKTRLGEFGCIQHDDYPFIGASPDGINVDPASPIYGRMVEIKNIFNREITGRPKEEYWIQTQIQMEVCDLDECDFVETRFKEYDSEAEYIADTNGVSGYTSCGNEKGIILWFQTAPALTQQGYVSQPIQLYEYAPIGVTPADEEYTEWEAAVFAKHECARNIWVRTIYWYLDEYSCVLVRRNRLWFSEAVKVLERVWATIEEERQTGYEHRAPAKKKTGTPPGAGGDATGTGTGSEFKIIKLESAIVPSATTSDTAATATATNMATLMAINSHMAQTNKKYGGVRGHAAKGPSEVLINCFKINDLEIDESKV